MTRAIWHPKAQKRRDTLRNLGVCINGSLPTELRSIRSRDGRIEHGPPVTKAGRCARCDAVYKHGKATAIALGLI